MSHNDQYAGVSDLDRVLAEIRALIAAGKPGDKLPSAVQLAQQFGVGQTTVKTALRDLRLAGEIRTHPGRGTFIPVRSRRR